MRTDEQAGGAIQHMVVSVINVQQRYLLNTVRIQKLAGWLLRMAVGEGQPRAWNEVTLVLTDNEGIEPVNRVHLSRQGATDVVSFTYPPMPGEGDGRTGEVLVNVQRAIERTVSRKNWDSSKELALYIAHGFDHLTGGRDRTVTGRARMRRTELRWLRQASILGLTNDLITRE